MQNSSKIRHLRIITTLSGNIFATGMHPQSEKNLLTRMWANAQHDGRLA